ncbi:fumarylacetoacetate hydrolase family protein [Amaricoccus solimangrovi]|uniref:Fumarylacetoacetate hydrolase family protein n=1 Tax=Amaricoccus solimangrovi TaxID=2589815 RepID=A0A501WZ89_9RHOB|nr:fumarylacetoacetate hydrolase family protein [Amaricoccus solimangrovi]TPE53027.1 fumarylacetoacetate hydrolase family protein [Amaricoccus solimangrovi]
MTEYAFPPAPRPALPIMGSDLMFPVRRVYCVGRNYAEHAREMGHDPDREPPFFFQKNPDNLVTGGIFPYPPLSADVHHEIELVVALGAGGRDIPAEEAEEKIFGYAVGLDMTRRDLQSLAKKAGRPWEVAKAFEASAPCGPIVPRGALGAPLSTGPVTLAVNGETRQRGDLADMVWSIPETISKLSELFELAPGDLLLTGTPAGVSAIHRGDRLSGRIASLPPLEVEVR